VTASVRRGSQLGWPEGEGSSRSGISVEQRREKGMSRGRRRVVSGGESWTDLLGGYPSNL
jgi:hypothetical protein